MPSQSIGRKIDAIFPGNHGPAEIFYPISIIKMVFAEVLITQLISNMAFAGVFAAK